MKIHHRLRLLAPASRPDRDGRTSVPLFFCLKVPKMGLWLQASKLDCRKRLVMLQNIRVIEIG
jgi:hypothetical protein